jgi:soluble P-type ATPase
MKYDIPGHSKPFDIRTLILDLNGTLSVAGEVPEGAKERLNKVKELGFIVVLFTGNTRGDADRLAKDLNIEWRLAATAEEKKDIAQEFNPDHCASIGNGLIDIELMKVVRLSIVTLQAEGAHIQTLLNSDIVVPHINDALDLFIDPNRLVATMRR